MGAVQSMGSSPSTGEEDSGHLQSRVAALLQLWLERIHFRSFLSLLTWVRVTGGVIKGMLLAESLGCL